MGLFISNADFYRKVGAKSWREKVEGTEARDSGLTPVVVRMI